MDITFISKELGTYYDKVPNIISSKFPKLAKVLDSIRDKYIINVYKDTFDNAIKIRIDFESAGRFRNDNSLSFTSAGDLSDMIAKNTLSQLKWDVKAEYNHQKFSKTELWFTDQLIAFLVKSLANSNPSSLGKFWKGLKGEEDYNIISYFYKYTNDTSDYNHYLGNLWF
jgi:hypothetical protein